MSQYVRLAQGIDAGKPVETPAAVAKRYAKKALPAPPRLTIASPADLSTASGNTVTVRGTTSARAVWISVNGVVQKVPVVRGVFSTTVKLTSVSNQIVIAAVGRNGATNQAVRTVTAFGTKIGGITDPTGDDNGPGSYVYPTNGAFNPGSFDITTFDVYRDGDQIRMVTGIAGAINNPWGGDGMSTQRLNIYLQTAAASGPATALLPGTNMRAVSPWTQAIVVDGRHATSTYGQGVYGPDLAKTGGVTLQVLPTTRQIVVTMPASVFSGVDLKSAGYQVSMFSDSDDGEGIGNVRPVYSLACWQGNGCPGFVGEYRVGGGAGVWDPSLPSVDTNTSDPNAIDIVNGATPQGEALHWTDGTTASVPYVHLS